MTERIFRPDDDVIDRLERKEGMVPGLDIQLDAEPAIAGDDEPVLIDDEDDPIGVEVVPEPDHV